MKGDWRVNKENSSPRWRFHLKRVPFHKLKSDARTVRGRNASGIESG